MPSELDLLVVRIEGNDQYDCDFHVRRSVVEEALHWLIANNKYYHAK